MGAGVAAALKSGLAQEERDVSPLPTVTPAPLRQGQGLAGLPLAITAGFKEKTWVGLTSPAKQLLGKFPWCWKLPILPFRSLVTALQSAQVRSSFLTCLEFAEPCKGGT